MYDYIEKLSGSPLFEGICIKEMDSLLSCLKCSASIYEKGNIIFLESQSIRHVGVILDGCVNMIKEDIWGNQTIFAYMNEGELFGETFACGSMKESKVTFAAGTDCSVLFIPFDKILHSCSSACIFHVRLIENMVKLIGDKNAQLMEKIEVTSKKNLREKILAYLSIQAQKNESTYFDVPLGRLAMAEYLCADRSALTRELSKMKDEGLLDYDGRTFRLLTLEMS